jgi:hypothetical protein
MRHGLDREMKLPDIATQMVLRYAKARPQQLIEAQALVGPPNRDSNGYCLVTSDPAQSTFPSGDAEMRRRKKKHQKTKNPKQVDRCQRLILDEESSPTPTEEISHDC